jgi:drug/metabolite transporter (DMT)-like permease
LLYLAIGGSALTFSLYYWLLSHLPAKRLALIAFLIPLEAVLIGALRGEPLTLKTLAGSFLVIGGVFLAVYRFASRGRA